MLHFNPIERFAHLQKFVHMHELSDKAVNIIVATGVAMYIAFILYREYSGLA